MEIALAILCGLAIGAVLGFVGAGGALLAVPMMIYIFDMQPVQATTAALIVVFGAALAGQQHVPKGHPQITQHGAAGQVTLQA